LRQFQFVFEFHFYLTENWIC